MKKNLYVTRADLPPFEEYMEEIHPLWESHWITNMGEKHDQLERELRAFLKVPYLSLMCNGHMSLELCLQAMHLRGEVVTTPFTFASTTHAIVRNGLTPVFADIREEDYTIDPVSVESCITPETSAIVAVHVYGNPCDVEALADIARRHKLKLIYDAAHAFGVEKSGRGIGSFGDASVFSFHATKVFHTIEGGAVSFFDGALKERLYCLKNFGIKGPEEVDGIGANAKMNEFQAAMGICNLRHIREKIALRKERWQQYKALLREVPGISCPADPAEEVKYNYAYFPIRVSSGEFRMDRDHLAAFLAEKNIFARKYFYPLTSSFRCYQKKCFRGTTPVAAKAAESVLTLPLFPEMLPEDVQRVADAVSLAHQADRRRK